MKQPVFEPQAQMSRNQGIDALRGIAILLVVVHHLALRIPLRDTALSLIVPRRVLNALSYSGYEAVFVFFVISGFLITSGSLRRWGSLSQLDLRQFYLRRISRIVPCLLLLLAVLAMMHLAGVTNYVIDQPGQSLAGALLSALGLYLNWYEGCTGWLPGGWDVLWSLSIEECFYLAFPLVCVLIRNRMLLLGFLTVFALSLPATRAALAGNDIWQEKAYLPGMAAIATGVMTALLLDGKAVTAWRAGALRLLGSAGLLAVLLYGRQLWAWFGNGYMLVLTGSAAMLIAGMYLRPVGRASPLCNWLCSFGRMSYEIYLTHMFVVFAIVAGYRGLGADVSQGGWWYLLLLPLCWGLGWLLARGFSVPCERALRGRWLRQDR
jgi:peptidoglycan/LPS O-acetylase OafA/YrhL